MTFGEKLQALRKENGMSQEKLSEQIHVSRQAISKWEQGLAMPDTDNVVQISRFFQVSLEFLLLDEYDSVEQLPPPAAQVQPPAVSNLKLSILLWVVGIALEVFSVFGAYVEQIVSVNNCYENPLWYLWELPLILTVLLGGVCLVLGTYCFTCSKETENQHKDDT